MAEIIMSIRDLTVQYVYRDRTVRAVNGISIDVEKGSIVGLVGETGAGKTTTARAIMQLLPKKVGRCGGQILFEEQDLTKLSPKAMQQIRGAKISMIFQDPMTSLNPVESVGSQIAEVIGLHNTLSKAEIQEKACQMLQLVGIPAERYHEYPHQFSGGMKQRVVIAMALACSPDLIIADEPTTALDVTIQAQVLELISDLQHKANTSVLLITHDMGVVAQMCDYVAVMYAGEIVEYGTIRQIMKEAQHPYTVGLFGSLPNLNEDVRRLATIEGAMPDPANLPAGCSFAPRCKHACQRCFEEDPPIVQTAPGHQVKCHLALSGDLTKGGVRSGADH